MLTLFENITEELTELEKGTLVPMLIDTLQYTTIETPIKGRHIVGYLKACGYKTDEIRLRKMVSYIRQMCLSKYFVICAGNKGYYASRDMYEIDKQIESIKGRRNQLDNVLNGLSALRENIRHRQLKTA